MPQNQKNYVLPSFEEYTAPKFVNQDHSINTFINYKLAVTPYQKPDDFSGDGNIVSLKQQLGIESITLDGRGKLAALLDTGVSPHELHFDLRGRIIDRVDFLNRNKTAPVTDFFDEYGHGTHLAGLIMGGLSSVYPQIGGIAPAAELISYKVTLAGSQAASFANIGAALSKIVEFNRSNSRKISVVNLSFNAFDCGLQPIKIQEHKIQHSLKELYQQHVAVVVSGGNYYSYFHNYGLGYPAYSEYVIAVGACGEYMHDGGSYLADFSQRIFSENKPGHPFFILAPGIETYSCGIKSPDSYTKLSGSSQAAAVVSGIILLMQQKAKKVLTVQEIKDYLFNHADDTINVAPPSLTGSPAFDGNTFKKLNALNTLNAIV